MTSPRDQGENGDDPRLRVAAEDEIRHLLSLLPQDVVNELNAGTIDFRDPSFLEALTDHVSRLALAQPQHGNRLLGKLGKVKKLLRRQLRDSNPSAQTSATITRDKPRVRRNEPCPCGSQRKFKNCCLRRTGS